MTRYTTDQCIERIDNQIVRADYHYSGETIEIYKAIRDKLMAAKKMKEALVDIAENGADEAGWDLATTAREGLAAWEATE